MPEPEQPPAPKRPAPPPVAPAVQQAPGMRPFGHIPKTRDAVFAHTLEAAKGIPAVENTQHRLEVVDPHYAGPESYGVADHKRALLTNQTLGRRLVGTVRLIDKATGNVVDEKKTTLAHVPYLTDHGTYVLDGSPYVLSSQLRLLPGAYVRRKDSGEPEAHVNTLPGTGVSHRLRLDPETGVLKVDVGQAQIPAAALFKVLGATDEEVDGALGKELAAANRKAAKPHHVDKLWEKFGPKTPAPQEEADKIAALRKIMTAYPLDPWVMKRTLGLAGKSRYDKEVALAAAKKIVDVNRGRAEPDDRDSLIYQSVWAPEHLIAERIARGAGVLKAALWQASNKRSLKAFHPGVLDKPIRNLFTTSGLAQTPEGVSSAEYVDHGSRITKIGEGGLGRGADSVPKSSRNVSPSHLGFIDLVKTPECWVGDAEVMTAGGWKRWDAVTPTDFLLCRVDDRFDYRTPIKLHAEDYDGPLYGVENELLAYLVTPDHRVWVSTHAGDEWTWSTAEKVHGDHVLHDVTQHHSEPVALSVARKDYYAVDYSGKVYCATVPGGMLYCRYKERNGFWSGNSESVGLDLRVAFGTRVGDDKKIYAPLHDTKLKRLVYRSPQDLADAAVAFPVTYERAARAGDPNAPVPAVVGGKLSYVPLKDVRYALPSMEQTFSPLSSMVPLKSGIKPQRASMAGRMISQALPLVVPEAPLVRTGVPGPGNDNLSFEELYGKHMGPVYARNAAGTVREVTPEGITVDYADGASHTHARYTDLPVGRKSSLTTHPLVKPGDKVQPGQILARSNYTDEKGHAAYGANARIAYYPYLRPGSNKATYEDAIGVSESFAKRLTSDHLYRHDFDTNAEGVIPGREAYAAAFPGRHPVELFKNYDKNGVVKPGTRLEPGQPIVMAVRRRDGGYGVGKARRAGLTDGSLVWEHDTPGEVADIVHSRDGVSVTVRTQRPMVSGDKLAGRSGNKGVVHILSDHEMPVGEDGKPFDVLYSPLGTVSRGNPGGTQIEPLLGKIAARTGQPEIIHDFRDGTNHWRDAVLKARRAGVPITETVTDPVTGKATPNVFTGVGYVMKLHHMADDKAKARGLGAYDEAGQPMRGPSGKAARMSLGDTMALLGHAAYGVLRDVRYFRGQKNEEFWLAFQGGYPPTRPAAYQQYERFLDQLRAAGIDPVRSGTRTHLKPLTPDRVNELAGDREVKVPLTVDAAKDDAPVPGGLHDPKIFGDPDLGEQKWGKVTLHEPLPSPVFEDPIRRLLGLTEQQYRQVLAGREPLNGRTGPGAVVDALRKYDVQKELTAARRQFESTRKTHREEAARKLQYLKALDRTGSTPADWVTTAVPVLPPSYRPVRRSAHGGLTVADANVLYADLMNANDAVRSLAGRVGDLGDERLAVYDAVKAAYGLGDPVNPKSRTKGVKGVLEQVFGSSSKRSLVQQKLLGTAADLSGRGVILPNPDLGMDDIGIPHALAWNLYQPFIVRRLVRQGVGRIEALRRVVAKDPMAQRALEDELRERPVVTTRYPVLHKYNTISAFPKLVPGSSIHINPYVIKGLGADYDGDQMSIHVPLSDEAVRDAKERMLPSRNLISPADFTVRNYLPSTEFSQGLHYASTANAGGRPAIFRSRAEALAAIKRGEIKLATPIQIVEG